MGYPKRKFGDYSAETSEDVNMGALGDDPEMHQPKRRNGKKRKPAKPDNLNWVKKRVRTIERSFRVGKDLPADKENDLQRELAHYKQKIVDAEDEKKKDKMIKKYHMIRFFERKKADRLAKQIQKQVDKCEDPEEKTALENRLHVAQIDSLYAKFFPYRERYISLYPVARGEKPGDASSAANALKSERPPLWSTIEKLAEKGIPALIQLRERKTQSTSRPPASQVGHGGSFEPRMAASRTKSSSVAKYTDRSSNGEKALKSSRDGEVKQVLPGPSEENGNESDSDGGFFEED